MDFSPIKARDRRKSFVDFKVEQRQAVEKFRRKDMSEEILNRLLRGFQVERHRNKLGRGIVQIRAGQGIVKTLKELERMAAEKMRVAQLYLPDPQTQPRATDCFWRVLLRFQRLIP